MDVKSVSLGKTLAIGVVILAALIVFLGVLGFHGLQRRLTPPYQVKIVNETTHTITNAVLWSEGGRPMRLGDFEPGAIQTFRPEFGETSIKLTHDVGETHFESESYYFAWEFIFEFRFAEAGFARVFWRIYPFDEFNHSRECFVCVKNCSAQDLKDFYLHDQQDSSLWFMGDIPAGHEKYKAINCGQLSWIEMEDAELPVSGDETTIVRWIVGEEGILGAPVLDCVTLR